MKLRNQIILLAGAALGFRLIALFDSFWLDEIWSLNIATHPPTWAESLELAVRTNCHLVITVWMRAISTLGVPPDWVYRLPSLAFSLATLLLGTRLAVRLEGVTARIPALVLFGFNVFFIQYGTEARGYSGLVFHSLVAVMILVDLLESRLNRREATIRQILFGVNACFGLLSHPLFSAMLFGASLWQGMRFIAKERPRRELAVEALVENALPLLLLGLPRALSISLQSKPDGPESSLLQISRAWAEWTFGIPDWSIPIGLCFLLLLLSMASCLKWATSPRERWVVVLLVFSTISPWAAIQLSGNSVMYERFLIGATPFALLLILRAALEAQGRIKGFWKINLAGLVLYGLLQTHFIFAFLDKGRGDYFNAVEEMARRTSSDTVSVGLDHLFRSGTLIDHYAPMLDSPKSFEKMDLRAAQANLPEWLLFHRIEDNSIEPKNPIEIGSQRYNRVAHYEKFGPSGWHWFLYRRLD